MRFHLRRIGVRSENGPGMAKYLDLFPQAKTDATASREVGEQSLLPLGSFARTEEAWIAKDTLFPYLDPDNPRNPPKSNPLIVVVGQEGAPDLPFRNLPIFYSRGREEEDEAARELLLRAGIPFVKKEVKVTAPPAVLFGGQTYPGLENLQSFVALWGRLVKGRAGCDF